MSASRCPLPEAQVVRRAIFSEQKQIETGCPAAVERSFVLRGRDVHGQFGVKQWFKQKQVVTSRDLDKSNEILRRSQ